VKAKAKKKLDRGGTKPPESVKDKKGSLIVIGTGIRTVGQLTVEAIAWLEAADRVLYVVGDPIAEATIARLNPQGAESMASYYEEGQPRIEAYNRMIERILHSVRTGETTVGAFYGHPGVFAYPSHESIRRARAEGYSAKMLPGISAEDCLYADLGVDPAVGGCQSYEATDFMLNGPIVDPSSQLILWQVGTLGDWTYQTRRYDTRSMPTLVQRLAQFYPLTHVITVYEAAMFPGVEPMVDQIPLYALVNFPITAAKTLYIPPARGRVQDGLALGWYAMANVSRS
jgi:uncharacterized protein YabN with tetrapyrrole methylase and pyrophosphatase domain